MEPQQHSSATPAKPDDDRAHERPGSETPSHEPAPVDLASESAAGEEDPGASIDLAITPPSDPPSGPKH